MAISLFDNKNFEFLLVEPLAKFLVECSFSRDESRIFIETLRELIRVSSRETRKQLYPLILQKVKDELLVVIGVDVPQEILPPNLRLSIKDVKVKCRGPDDRIYARNPDLQQYIPRGLALLFRKNQRDHTQEAAERDEETDQDEELIDVVTFANRKFTGCIGDEDEMQPDSDDEWKKTFLAVPESADFIVSTEKVNGEAAHLSGRYIGSQFYIITGSKNVHMMIRNEDDIKLYVGTRYCTASVVASNVCQVMGSLTKEKREMLQHFLHFTRATLVCEQMQKDYQHIVNLDHLPSNRLKVVALYCAPESLEATSDSLTAMPVHLMLQFFEALGLDIPHYDILPDATEETLAEHRHKVRTGRETEGRVMYYLQHPSLRTIGMTKIKTVWYIIVRAVREKAVYGLCRLEREPDKYEMADLERSTKKRLLEIQRWLKLSDNCRDSWTQLAMRFLTWLEDRRTTSYDGNVRNMELRPSFPRIWNEFLEDQPPPGDNIPLYS